MSASQSLHGCLNSIRFAYTGGQENGRVEEIGEVHAGGHVEVGRRRHERGRERQGRRGHGLVASGRAAAARGSPQDVREARIREGEGPRPRIGRRLDAP